MISKQDCETLLHIKGVYYGMRGRCYSNKNKDYRYYGERKIKICDEWLNDFYSFYAWSIKNGYKQGLSIDRIDNDGDYSPNNCRWVTTKEQANNKRRKLYVTFEGQTLSVAEWSKKLGIPTITIYSRLRKGFCPSEILSNCNLKTLGVSVAR